MGMQTRFTIVDHTSNNVLADDLTIDEAAEFVGGLPDIESHDVHVYPVQTNLRSRWNSVTKRQRILELEAECRDHVDRTAYWRRRAALAESRLANARKELGVEAVFGQSPAVTTPQTGTVFHPQNS